MFPQFKIKKNGRNNFQKYNYFKLEDLIPVDNAICKKLKLFTLLNQENEQNIHLEVYDLEQGDEQEPVCFYIPACPINNGNITQGSQEHGNVQTYCWRYLLYQLWNVSEADEIDASEIGINTPIEKIETTVTPERAKELAKEIGQAVADKGGDNFNKKHLQKEVDERLNKKQITNEEYIEIKKLIDGM